MKNSLVILLVCLVSFYGYFFRSTGAEEYCGEDLEYGFWGESCDEYSLVLERTLYSKSTQLEVKLNVPFSAAGRFSVFTNENSSSYWLNYKFHYKREKFSSGVIIKYQSRSGFKDFIEGRVAEGRYIYQSETDDYEIYKNSNDKEKKYYLSKDESFYIRCEAACWFQGVVNNKFFVKYGFPREWLNKNYNPLRIPELVLQSILDAKFRDKI
jgi:hypothetical protein